MTGNAEVVRAAAGNGRNEVHIWHYPLDLDPVNTAQCARLLDEAEMERARRFRFETHRRRSVVGRGTLRTILAHHAGCDPQAVRFGYGEYGKPYIAGPDCACDLKFSVSNCGDLGAVAVTWRTEAGLDIEQVRPCADHDMIAAHQFSAEESDWFQSLREERRLAAFFELWTCKESYLKGKGLGLSASLKSFSVSLGPDVAPRLVWSDIDNDDPQRWSLRRVYTESGYIACLALDGDCRALHAAPWRGRS
jgi:4'-phosphopantetheinyl transferase